MTIRNFYLVAVCALWLLVLLWMTLKLAADTLRRQIRRRKARKIERLFSCECSSAEFGFGSRQAVRYSRDKLLMNYICDCYTQADGDRNRQSQFMASVLDSRIAALRADDRAGRCQLASEIGKCGVSSRRIDGFLRNYEQDYPKNGQALGLHALR